MQMQKIDEKKKIPGSEQGDDNDEVDSSKFASETVESEVKN